MAFRSLALPALALAAGLALGPGAAMAETIRYGLNWLPQAEHCGFYEAQEKGLYKAAGLDVTIEPGGPDRNVPLMVSAGQLDLGMGSSFTTLNLLKEGIAAQTVAAFFQKDPQTLVAHAGEGVETLEDAKGKAVMIAKFSQYEFWQFLKTKYGFRDEDLRPYTYSAAPFLADPKAIQQGYVTEDALLLGKELPQPPVVILLADYGYQNYATTVFGTKAYLESHADAVKAFLRATAEGYAACIAGDYQAAMKAVLAANPDHSEELFHFKMKQMIERGLVLSGDAESGGLGAMSDARWKDFFDTMVASGVYDASLDYKAAYSLDYLPK
ncbi:ABC transporter substrate-binding protein [Prosthecomicrobium pneumaticum]|uniref:NitT/TauT family transport system substrate-binding protein n=1 Tax=Prosthecomicrobium pneumaticum TaxID=81895 RepID=A0A7W9FLL4_9HYPH|nr:ABC transporter substrate-binding protein [Prosthecomicrobium pneumaticum]MBB5752911.1 NitT/TauT family transport system substrate-binding protein [Prosthecomicrobium pneumaticum]